MTAKWCFSLDEDAFLLHLKDGFSPETEVIYVGSLKVEIDASEQEEVAQKLLEDFNYVPTFLPHDLHKSFIMGSVNSNCGLFFIICCPCVPTMAIALTASEHMLWNGYGQLFSRHASNVQRPLQTTISNLATAKPPSLAPTWPLWCTLPSSFFHPSHIPCDFTCYELCIQNHLHPNNSDFRESSSDLL